MTPDERPFRYRESGHDFTPSASDSRRCQYAGAGYCSGKRNSPEHERIEIPKPEPGR